jgi:hypothetical protein
MYITAWSSKKVNFIRHNIAQIAVQWPELSIIFVDIQYHKYEIRKAKKKLVTKSEENRNFGDLDIDGRNLKTLDVKMWTGFTYRKTLTKAALNGLPGFVEFFY